MSNTELVIQSLDDRLGGLVDDVERQSSRLWAADEVDLARRLEQLATRLHDARVALSKP